MNLPTISIDKRSFTPMSLIKDQSPLLFTKSSLKKQHLNRKTGNLSELSRVQEEPFI